MNFSDLSFKKQFYFTMFGIGSIIMIAGFSFNILSAYRYKETSFLKECKLQAELIANNSLAPLMFFDKDGMRSTLSQLKDYEDVLQVIIYDSNNDVFARYNPKNMKVPKSVSDTTDSFFRVDMSTSRIEKVKIFVNGIDYGVLLLEKDTSILKSFLIDAVLNVVMFFSVLVIIMIFIIKKFSDRLISPIVDLANTLSELSESQNYSTRLYYNSDNEVGKLYSAFNNLFISIGIHQKSRDQALAKATSYQKHLESLTNDLEERVQERTSELQNSIEIIKKAQNQLVESEKMVALGSLVSGVAHEVNTPLGNAVTGSSIIKRECHSLLEMMNNATLKKSVLEKKLSHMEETSKLLFKSVTNAADLIKSFKKISIDQSVERERDFDLNEYINEIILTFHNKLKQVPVNVTVSPNKALNISSFPGAFAQLFNNFIQNSILHGFENFQGEAKIDIELTLKDNILHIVYKDNGNGMQESIRQKAFEPFITTKRNAGGTGLGLNIVYNIVHQKLKGELKLETSRGDGCKFIIDIPIKKKINSSEIAH